MRRILTWLAVVVAVVGLATIPEGSRRASAAPGDGPAPCSAGLPPSPYRGYCGTYNGINTYWGSYGLGFPTPDGWGFCAERPGSGSAYPSPSYAYQLSGPPAGADASLMGPLGYAYSTATVQGFWNGAAGQFTADQAAVAGKLLYDAAIWHAATGTMDSGVQAAYTQLLTWMVAASGATGPPGLAVTLVGGGVTFTTTATIRTRAVFPGSGNPVSGVTVLVGLSNATFDGTGGATSALGATDANGRLDQPITASGSGPVSVTVTSLARVGRPTLEFFRPTAYLTSAQTIAAGSSPIYQAASATFSSQAPPPTTGTISVLKTGDDTAYFGIAEAQFQILSGSNVLATVVTDEKGLAGPSAPIPPGTYTVHESVAPPGYLMAPDQTAVVTAGADTLVSFTGVNGDRIEPATIDLHKTSTVTGEALSGAVLSVRYDQANDGSFPTDLGTCTTGADGSCRPSGNDGVNLLPGRYRIEEISPPPGYALDPSSVVILDLGPGQAGSVTFRDPPLVPQSFLKVATGNVDPTRAILSGATFVVSTPAGAPVTSCVTGTDGTCTTESLLIADRPYCWAETIAPVGLDTGGSGCFTAASSATPIPITVEDPGRWVEIRARKVDAAAPTIGVPGAVFDLYRMDHGTGPDHPTPPVSAHELSGGTWVDRATGHHDGLATFALQLPDFAYCVIEHQPPSGYVADPSAHCTDVLTGTTASPPTTATIEVADAAQMISLIVDKTNAAEPGTGVPGAIYDLYAQAPFPAVTPIPDPSAPVHPGLGWFASGTTGPDGHLSFVIPAGHAWCLAERSAPVGFILDTGLHCTAVLNTDTSRSDRTVAMAETVDSVTVQGFKFNARQPGTGIPGASYALFVVGSLPAGFIGPLVPDWLRVPTDMALFAIGISDESGHMTFSVPIGHAWCMAEISAPPGYIKDTGLHCTAVLDHSSDPIAVEVALPETAQPELAQTGMRLPLGAALVLIVTGAGLRQASRRRRRTTAR